ncbi:hypothetical protein M5X00_23795 [Paenibacillus alvei]|uniref:Uncharacterized protein n=1 Tax=Paenibacillus alvei TaxID=44250 RepID=A0AAP7A274_PAEAL|nr:MULTISPECIES: hypothetical protein [Paenibacillus]EJW15022.1 hypothetical protein PAV_10c01400 [Paenibacillus alvei DSM 29]MBG9734719.1 hypothetical protein [Paenibacillus alvei]MBG9742970.1 hypothetical protein [Paenibacillus alvei]MCY7483440.1 hypothetical protein [Paenibacillus alvei]MCY9541063.1 hypothetical protein [Paenibacillus alvei]
MIPFENTLPYDHVMGDLYVSSCPFCHKDNVLLPIKPSELPDIHDGKKRLLVFPCCRNRLVIVDADSDYLLADRAIR